MVESSTKQYPTNLKIPLDIAHLKATPYPLAQTAFRRGVLTKAHPDGALPLPCSSPWGGGL
eukprot:7497837-Ditylum_brightwellii.AAC.1